MSKQNIEVGQYWVNNDAAMIAEVLSVSPAWIKVRDIEYEHSDSMSVRRGEFGEQWKLSVHDRTVTEAETPVDPDFAEVEMVADYDASARSIAIAHAAVAAFNAQTDMDMQASDVFLLLHNLAIVQGRTDDGPELVRTDVDFLALYEEAR